MVVGRIVIIPFLHGKVDAGGVLREPDIDTIFKKWMDRHPELLGPERDFKIIRGTLHLMAEGIETDLVRVTARFSSDLEAYDPAEDADLYDEFLADGTDRTDSPPQKPHKIWIEQCAAVEKIESDYGTEKALGYLIGEKLLNFLEVAEGKPEWRAEIPEFIETIKQLFENWQIAEFFETPRRLGVFGHIADESQHEAWRRQMDDSEKLREDTSKLLMFEWARQLLMDEQPE